MSILSIFVISQAKHTAGVIKSEGHTPDFTLFSTVQSQSDFHVRLSRYHMVDGLLISLVRSHLFKHLNDLFPTVPSHLHKPLH